MSASRLVGKAGKEDHAVTWISELSSDELAYESSATLRVLRVLGVSTALKLAEKHSRS